MGIGIVDITGKEIKDGDILIYKDHAPQFVRWNKECEVWGMSFKTGATTNIPKGCEIAGNIYDEGVNIMNIVAIDKDDLEHLLNCMCNQKFIHEQNSETQKEWQEIIDKSYHDIRAKLSPKKQESA